MSSDSKIMVCPDCDSSFIRHRPRHSDGDWRCQDCKAIFDDPVRRERYRHGHTEGLALKLEQMDPDELGGVS
jgi:ribosomal protein L37AE/L43A